MAALKGPPQRCKLCGKKNRQGSLRCYHCDSKFVNQKRQIKKMKTWFNIAKEMSKLSTCPKLNVGSVAINDNRVIGTGYNGSPSKLDHCEEEGCLIIDGHCIRSLHAEENVLIASPDKDLVDADLFITHQPCSKCILKILQCEVRRVFFLKKYENLDFDYMDMVESKGVVMGHATFQGQEYPIEVLNQNKREINEPF